MDGNGTLFGTLSGNTREVLHKFSVDLPKKHGRGGQSALRFARLRMEKRHNYLILGGSADFKTELSQSDMFDPRLQAKILNVVDVSYGGENDFNQAIELSADVLSNVKFIHEKKLIGKCFEEISQDSGKYVFGVDDTLKSLEMGAVEILLVWESLDINIYELKNGSTGETIVKHLNKEQENNQSSFRDSETNAELEVRDKMSLLEWFANEYRKFGCSLEFVTNNSQKGSQFCRGFGGIGGILRYQQGAREVGVATAASELVLKSVSGLIKEAPLSDPEKLDKVLSSGSLSKGLDRSTTLMEDNPIPLPIRIAHMFCWLKSNVE
ncbi:hypothetical protein ACLB2K_020849 [Fragaria x ananassa]